MRVDGPQPQVRTTINKILQLISIGLSSIETVDGRQNGVEVINEEPGAVHISIDTIQIYPKRSSCHNGVKTVDE